jgi:hypothetical protein
MTFALLKPTTRASVRQTSRAGKLLLLSMPNMNETGRFHAGFPVVGNARQG